MSDINSFGTPSLSQYLKTSSQPANVNEVFGVILAGLCVATVARFALTPLLNSEFGKAMGETFKSIGGGFAALFGGLFGKKDKKDKDDKKKDKWDDDKKEKKSKDDKDNDKDNDDKDNDKDNEEWWKDFDKKSEEEQEKIKKDYQDRCTCMNAAIQEQIDKMPDGEEKEKLQADLDFYRSISVDEEGKELSNEEKIKKIKDLTGKDPDEIMKSLPKMDDSTPEKKAELEEALKKYNPDNLSEEEKNKILESEKKRAKDAAVKIKAEKEKLDKTQEEIDKINKQIEEAKKDDKKEEVEKLEKEKNKHLEVIKNGKGPLFEAARERNGIKQDSNTEENPDKESEGNNGEAEKDGGNDNNDSNSSSKPKRLNTPEKIEAARKRFNNLKGDTEDEIAKREKEAREKHDKETLDELKKMQKKLDDAATKENELYKKLENEKDPKKQKEIEAEIQKNEKVVNNIKQGQDKKVEKQTKEYSLKGDDGKEDKLVKRPKKIGDGFTWYWKSKGPNSQTVSDKEARKRLKDANIKEGLLLDLEDWLWVMLS